MIGQLIFIFQNGIQRICDCRAGNADWIMAFRNSSLPGRIILFCDAWSFPEGMFSDFRLPVARHNAIKKVQTKTHDEIYTCIASAPYDP